MQVGKMDATQKRTCVTNPREFLLSVRINFSLITWTNSDDTGSTCCCPKEKLVYILYRLTLFLSSLFLPHEPHMFFHFIQSVVILQNYTHWNTLSWYSIYIKYLPTCCVVPPFYIYWINLKFNLVNYKA